MDGAGAKRSISVASAGPHAVTSVAGTVNGVANPGFAYDANGNMTSGAGRTYAYASFNMAASITAGAASAAFTYDANHNRVVQTATAGTTYYLNDAASGAMSELYNPGHVWRDYILADGRLVLVRTLTGTTASYQYLTTDHLGSVTVIADQAGAVLQRLSYDAWGARRNPDGTVPTSPITGQTTRGFTGQEAMDALGLINFNARLHDPQLARFLAADPTISNAYLDQLLDRYGYVGNNPLSLTDPSGLCFLGCFWESGIFRDVLAIVAAFTLNYEILPVLEGGEIGTTVGLSTFDIALNAGISGGVAGAITSGNLKGALLGAAEAVAFFEVGNVLQADKLTGPAQTAATFVAHGAVGGLFTVAGGGRFGSGFLAAGVGSLGDNINLNNGDVATKTAEHAILGGVGSVLGGGKFENGAITGAFGYLFNSCNHIPGGCWHAFKDVASMSVDWLLGTGQGIRFFGPGTIEVSDLVDAPGVNAARYYFYRKNSAAIAAGDPLQPVTNYAFRFGLRDLFATSSPTQQFIGSYGIDIFPSNDGNNITFVLSNDSSLKSLLYGIAPDWERYNFVSPMGNMRQCYYWTESIRK